MEPIIFKDKNNYCYLYSFNKRKLIYISSPIYYILDSILNENTPIDLVKKQINSHVTNSAEIEKIINQINFLQDNGFIDKDNINKQLMPLTHDELNKSIPHIEAITFEVTQKCNLSCEYCVYGNMYDNQENNHGRELTYNQAVSVLDFLFEKYNSREYLSFNKRIIIGFYGGEPLLNFDLIEKIVTYSKSKYLPKLNIEFTLTTNCLLLEEYMDFIVSNDFTILLSLDGDFNSSIYRTPKIELFNKIINNIGTLKNKYPDYFMKKVAFNSVLHDKNNIPHTISYIKNNFNITPLFSEVSPVSLSFKKNDTYLRMRKIIVAELLKDKYEMSLDDYIKTNPEIRHLNKFFNSITGVKIDYLPSLLNHQKITKFLPTSTCSPFSYKLFVDATGTLHPCEKIGYKYPLGYVDATTNKVNINFKSISNEYNAYYSDIFKICYKCYNFYTCSTCLLEKKNHCSQVNKEEFSERLKYFVDRIIEEKQFFSKNKNVSNT